MRYYLVFLYGCFVLVNGSVNYCGSKMCRYTNDHTLCKYPPGPGPACYGYIPAALTQEDKARVLSRMNKRRAEIAYGLSGYPPAGDMLELRWIEELEREAQRWADQCRPPNRTEERDSCRDLYSVSVGQSVASVVGEAPGLRPETMVDMWFMQKIHYRGNITEYIPPVSPNHFYGDYAQLIWAETFMVGCGRSRFMITKDNRHRSVERLVCNFAPRGPVPSRPLWSINPPAGDCPNRALPDQQYIGLCSYKLDQSEYYSENMDAAERAKNVLLDVVMQLESYDIVNTIGTLDEMYLTKLAAVTHANRGVTEANNYMKKRNINGQAPDNNIIRGYNNAKLRSSPKLLGRPKSYDIEELNDVTTAATENNADNNISTNAKQTYAISYDNEMTDRHDNFANATILQARTVDGFATSNFSSLNPNDTNVQVENYSELLTILAEELSNLSVAHIFYNITTGDEKFINELLSNPETAQALQAAVKRLEEKMGTQAANAKMRREIRRMEEEVNPDLLKDIERNRTRDRGPVLNMVLKYVPYLKQYEETLMGSNSSSAFSIHTFFSWNILLLILYTVFYTLNSIVILLI